MDDGLCSYSDKNHLIARRDLRQKPCFAEKNHPSTAINGYINDYRKQMFFSLKERVFLLKV
jgi:hypothetical protein